MNKQTKHPPKKNKLLCVACFLGPPSSGKGTAAKLISKEFGFPIITPGDIYKVLREEDSETGRLVKESLKDGGYCPDYLTNQIMLTESQRLAGEGARGVLMDGYPRSLVQLEFLRENWDVGLYLHTESPYKVLEKFVINRVECPDCGRVQSLIKPEGLCACQRISGWKQRWDDTALLFPKRYDTYQALTFPVIEKVCSLPEYTRYDFLMDESAWPQMEERVKKLLENRGLK